MVCYVGVGSNLGNRRKNIQLALQEIRLLKDTKLLKASGIIETKPVGGPPKQNKFLNAAIKIETRFSPQVLLKKLKNIEKKLGRTPSVRWGPRIIDLDILFYGDKIVNTPELTIPHPRIFEREFVLKPLREII